MRKSHDGRFGDYLAEVNIAINALEKHQDPSKGYEALFAQHLEIAVDFIAKRKLKVVPPFAALACVDADIIGCRR